MSEFAGAFDESTEGEELASVIVKHWHIGAASTVYVDELIYAHEVTGISLDDIAAVVNAVNEFRHHDDATDVLAHAFVPSANLRDVCALLDQIQSLCVRC